MIFRRRKMKKTKYVVAGLVAVGVIALGIEMFAPKKVNIQEYVDAEVKGVSGKGILRYEIMNYFPKELGVKLKASKTKNIKNGDVIKFDVSCNDEKCKEYGITLTDKHAEWTVGGLADYSKKDGNVKEGHKFYATTDMNDEIAKVLLDTMEKDLKDEIDYENGLGSSSELSFVSGRLLGIYTDKDTGNGTNVLAEFIVKDHQENKKMFLCFDFFELKDYVTGTDIKNFNNESYINSLEHKTDSFGMSMSYAKNQNEVDKLMEKENLVLTEYKYPQ